MKALIFDADKSLASIGGPDRIRELFGYDPVSVSGGIRQISALLERMTEVKRVKVEHPVFGETGAIEEVYALKDEAREAGLGAIVIDSLSVVGYQEREAIQQEQKLLQLDMQAWGLYGQRLMQFVHRLSRLDIPVVVTSHIDRQTDENGGPIELPAFKGAGKTEAARFFDVICYSKVNRGRKGEASFVWQIIADSRRSQAKSRLQYPTETGVVEQDLAPIIAHYKEQGLAAPKILIIGDSGSGKTKSLETLANA